MPLFIVRGRGGDRTKARRRAITASVTIVALAAMGLWVAFSGCKGDNAADDQSRGAAATGTDENAGAQPAGQSGTASAESLAEALRGVITEMLEETGADLSPEQVRAETEARYREGVEAVRRFYPEFLEETMPAGPETAEKRIAAVIRVFGQVLAASPFHDVPIEAWLLVTVHTPGRSEGAGWWARWAWTAVVR